MPEVICDTSPLQYLHQIGHLEILPRLADRVIVPVAVEEELAIGRRAGVDLSDPRALQWLGDEALRNAIVFGRIPDHEGTIMRRLSDLPHFDEVVQKKGIDELFTTGWLEMALSRSW